MILLKKRVEKKNQNKIIDWFGWDIRNNKFQRKKKTERSQEST